MVKYTIDPRIERLGIKGLLDFIDEATGLGWEYSKICGSCGEEYRVCVFIHITQGDVDFKVGLKGLSIELGINTPVDREFLLGLMKYVETVKSERGMATLYIPEIYAMGAYYMICRDRELRDPRHFIVEYDEIRYLERG